MREELEDDITRLCEELATCRKEPFLLEVAYRPHKELYAISNRVTALKNQRGEKEILDDLKAVCDDADVTVKAKSFQGNIFFVSEEGWSSNTEDHFERE